MPQNDFLNEHLELARRYFLKLGIAGAVLGQLRTPLAADEPEKPAPRVKPEKAGVQPDPYFTPAIDFQDVSRGKPIPHSLSDEKKREVGLTRETWKLDVLSDTEHPARLRKQFTKAEGTAFDFDALMKLAETKAVRFAKVMTCLNLGCPLGMGLWEGVPLRELIWMTEPRENLRRIYYYGFHNDDPQQMFRSSLPIGRVLEDPFGLPPVILCYKLNGEWLDAERGGPVRIVVPEHYGFKSIKWLSHLVLSNIWFANDTYGEQNNDVDSPLKTFSATLSSPAKVAAGEPLAVSGYAQVGIAGLSKVQVSLERNDARPEGDPNFEKAPWIDAELFPAPERWGGFADGKLPLPVHGFDDQGKPKSWPMHLTNAHWAAKIPGVAAGEYTLRSRTIDANGIAQPMPRPYRKSGHATIESIGVKVGE